MTSDSKTPLKPLLEVLEKDPWASVDKLAYNCGIPVGEVYMICGKVGTTPSQLSQTAIRIHRGMLREKRLKDLGIDLTG